MIVPSFAYKPRGRRQARRRAYDELLPDAGLPLKAHTLGGLDDPEDGGGRAGENKHDDEMKRQQNNRQGQEQEQEKKARTNNSRKRSWQETGSARTRRKTWIQILINPPGLTLRQGQRRPQLAQHPALHHQVGLEISWKICATWKCSIIISHESEAEAAVTSNVAEARAAWHLLRVKERGESLRWRKVSRCPHYAARRSAGDNRRTILRNGDDLGEEFRVLENAYANEGSCHSSASHAEDAIVLRVTKRFQHEKAQIRMWAMDINEDYDCDDGDKRYHALGKQRSRTIYDARSTGLSDRAMVTDLNYWFTGPSFWLKARRVLTRGCSSSGCRHDWSST